MGAGGRSGLGENVRKLLALGLAALLMLSACTSGGDDDPVAAEGAGSSTSEPAGDPAEVGKAPGVTDDAIEVGVTFVDTEAIKAVIDTDHGDYRASYQALFDHINAEGGIHGRRLEAVYAPINPLETQPAEEACLRLTEDEQVFVVVGFAQDDTLGCYLEVHATALVGGTMHPERLATAEAPWFSVQPSADVQADGIRAFHEEGHLDGKVAVFALDNDEATVRQVVEPLLGKLGVDVVEVGFNDAPDGDVAAGEARATVLLQRFEAVGADTVLVVGSAGGNAADGVARTDFRPTLLFASYNELQGWINDAAGNDLSVLEGALAAGQFGPKPDQWDEPTMQECLEILGEAGIEVPKPPAGQPPRGTPQPFVSAISACQDVYLLRAILEAAGPDLDYATFRAAGEGLGELQLPGHAKPFRYGPPPSADGDMPIHLFRFDPATKSLARLD